MLFLDNNHLVTGLAPVADAFAGATVNSDVINVENYGHVSFLIWKAVGAVGTSTVTVEACDNTTPSTTTAIPFKYARKQDSDDTWGAVTDATAAGFATTAGSNEMYLIEVDVADIAEQGCGYVRLDMAEVADAAVLGGILVILSEPRYGAVAAIA